MTEKSFGLVLSLVILSGTLGIWLFFPRLAWFSQKLLKLFPLKTSLGFWLTYALGLVLFLGGFIGTVVWFKQVDIYHQHFFNADHHLLHLFDNLNRVFFTLYLFLIFYFVGAVALKLISKLRGDFQLNQLDELIASFFVGVGILQIALFALGLFGGYSFIPLFGASLLVLLLGYPRFLGLIRSILATFAQAHPPNSSLWVNLAYAALISIFSVSALLLVITKGLFPGGGGDYFTHYFPYYLQVIKQGGLAPNDVWYHFYNSKGANIVFYGIVLADPHAPQLVSLCLIIGSVLALYSLIRSVSDDSLGAWLAIIIYVSGLIYTQETGIGFHFWAEFQKQHILTASLLAGIFWLMVQMYKLTPSLRGIWAILVSIVFIGLYILRPQLAPMLTLFLAILGLTAWFQRQKQNFWLLVGLGIIGLATLLGVLGLNYSITGLAEVTPFRFFWRFANQEMFSHWVSPYLMVLLGLGSSAQLGEFSQLNSETLNKLAIIPVIMRLDRLKIFFYLLPILFTNFLTSWIIISSTNHRESDKKDLYTLLFLINFTVSVLCVLIYCTSEVRPLITFTLGLSLLLYAILSYQDNPSIKLIPDILKQKKKFLWFMGNTLLAISLMLGIFGYFSELNPNLVRFIRIFLAGVGIILLMAHFISSLNLKKQDEYNLIFSFINSQISTVWEDNFPNTWHSIQLIQSTSHFALTSLLRKLKVRSQGIALQVAEFPVILGLSISYLSLLIVDKLSTSPSLITRAFKETRHKRSILILVWLLAAFIASSMVMMLLVINQTVSLYRLYVFSLFFVIIAVVVSYLLPFNLLPRSQAVTKIVSTLAVLIGFLTINDYLSQMPLNELNNNINFARGNFSIYEAYATQNAVWQAGIESRKIVGPSARIWSSQITGKYCMSPDCLLETFFSYSMGKDWHKIILEDAEIAKTLLRQQGLNYFLIDTSDAFFDVLPYSQLFSPNQIDQHLQMLWTDGKTYLLTWPSALTKPLPPQFRQQYGSSIGKALQYADFKGMYTELKLIYQQNKEDSYPLKIAPNLPPVRGWQ